MHRPPSTVLRRARRTEPEELPCDTSHVRAHITVRDVIRHVSEAISRALMFWFLITSRTASVLPVPRRIDPSKYKHLKRQGPKGAHLVLECGPLERLVRSERVSRFTGPRATWRPRSARARAPTNRQLLSSCQAHRGSAPQICTHFVVVCQIVHLHVSSRSDDTSTHRHAPRVYIEQAKEEQPSWDMCFGSCTQYHSRVSSYPIHACVLGRGARWSCAARQCPSWRG